MNDKKLIPSKEVCAMIAKAAAAEKRAQQLRWKACLAMREEAAAKGRTEGFTKDILADLLNEESGTGVSGALAVERDVSCAHALISSRVKAAKTAGQKAAATAVDSIRAA